MRRPILLLVLCLAGCSSSSSPPAGPRQDVDWGDRRPVRLHPEPNGAPPPASSTK